MDRLTQPLGDAGQGDYLALDLLHSGEFEEEDQPPRSGKHDQFEVVLVGRVRCFTTIVFPQAFRIAFPSLVNQFVDIVKDSSIVAIIGTTDLFGVTNRLVSYYRAPFELYTLVAAFYLTIVLTVSMLAAQLERRLTRHVAR